MPRSDTSRTSVTSRTVNTFRTSPTARASRTSRRLALVAPAALGAFALTVLPAAATSTPAQIATSKTNGVTYVKSLQAADGSYAGLASPTSGRSARSPPPVRPPWT